MTTKDKILDLLDKTDRQGIDEVMDWLKGSGFFTAPASTHFHGNYEGGLAEHSLNVYTAAMRLRSTALSLTPSLEEQLPEEKAAVLQRKIDAIDAILYDKQMAGAEAAK